MTRNSPPVQGAKNKSPEIAATIIGAINTIYNGQQKYGTHNGQTIQGLKHISFCFSWLLELMESALEAEYD